MVDQVTRDLVQPSLTSLRMKGPHIPNHIMIEMKTEVRLTAARTFGVSLT